MSWRIVLVSKPCKLSLRNNQLLYQPADSEDVTLPLEDISVIILEERQVTITSYLLSELANYGIVLFSCDQTRTPSGIFTPFHQHSRYSEMAWLQIEWSEPFKKRVWQKIIQAKIQNQIDVLKISEIEGYQKMEFLVEKVQSGDSTNIESFAARIYWDTLFDKFKRRDMDIRNLALNYGYSIIRGAIARFIVTYGLMPCFGIKHANKLNAFNLADDLMEPFRPFVDILVFKMFEKYDITKSEEKLSYLQRQELVNVLTHNCLQKNEIISLLKASDSVTSLLANATREKDFNILQLPGLII